MYTLSFLNRFPLLLLIYSLHIPFFALHAQTGDSVITNFSLSEVEVTGYINPQPFLQTPVSVGLINKEELEVQSTVSLLPAMNSIPSVRMEERSPGSYRLSIRGSLVRSPYGVRNIKVYYNDFALTDAGGNTYLNVLNVSDIAGVEILKGPDGSLFGANSGGVVLLQSNTDTLPALDVNVFGGSFGLAGNSFNLARNAGKHFFTVKQSYIRSDGYRQNTRNHRFFIQFSDRWIYHAGNFLEAFIFYSDLRYRTPGGLTEEQYKENPEQARPPTATMPGSVEQKTNIITRMPFAGIRHHGRLSANLSHTLSLWYNHVDFIYPFITNYETRKENNMGLRTYFILERAEKKFNPWKTVLNFGFEGQRLVTDAANYDNHAGIKGDIQAYNNILNYHYFGFIRGKVEWNKKLILEAAISLNRSGYHFRDTTNFKNNFGVVWMPHIALNYKLAEPLALRFIFSKGFSNPTAAEVRPSDNKIHKDLMAEHGWNTEAGFRMNILNGRLSADASIFHYYLHDGIISQTDSTGNTYFINSGKIRQLGVEYNSSFLLLPYKARNRFFRKIQWKTSYTYARYKYRHYASGEKNFSGNSVAGIPRHVLINSLYFNLPKGIYCFIQHNFTDKIPLNDANTVFADTYHLVNANIGIEFVGKKYCPSKIYLMLDNILNEKYSLGNDLNAMGGRYFNAAPTFNFQLGVRWNL